VAGLDIHLDRLQEAGIDTVTLYVGPQNQPGWYEYILGLKPRRIIFNPGTENPELEQKAQAAVIQTEEACTLVMPSVRHYNNWLVAKWLAISKATCHFWRVAFL